MTDSLRLLRRLCCLQQSWGTGRSLAKLLHVESCFGVANLSILLGQDSGLWKGQPKKNIKDHKDTDTRYIYIHIWIYILRTCCRLSSRSQYHFNVLRLPTIRPTSIYTTCWVGRTTVHARTMQNIEQKGGVHMDQHRRVLITQDCNISQLVDVLLVSSPSFPMWKMKSTLVSYDQPAYQNSCNSCPEVSAGFGEVCWEVRRYQFHEIEGSQMSTNLLWFA